MLGYTPNRWAYEQVHTSSARFNTFCTCRQCGKTETLSMLIHEAATETPDPVFGPPRVGVLSYDYDHAEMSVFRWLDRLKVAGIPFKANINEHTVHLPWNGNAEVRWLTAENPWSVAGWTWSDFFVDEAQAVGDEVYQKMRPGLDVRMARLFAFGTPDVVPDQTWFEGLFLRGQDPDEMNYHSFTLPCYENPWMTLEAVREAREGNMTPEVFRMLYLGQWIQTTNKVFPREHVEAAPRRTQLEGPLAGRTYVAGLDVASAQDWTVLYIMDAMTKEVVFKWRMSRLDYPTIEDRVVGACKLFNVMTVMAELNGPGRPVIDHLRQKGLTVHDISLSNKNKGQMVESLASDLAFKRITLLKDDYQLDRELIAYLKKPSPSGKIVYSAPEGFFDDTVIALAYAAEMARTRGSIQMDSWASWGTNSLAQLGARIA
jgi:hypothetical protein